MSITNEYLHLLSYDGTDYYIHTDKGGIFAQERDKMRKVSHFTTDQLSRLYSLEELTQHALRKEK